MQKSYPAIILALILSCALAEYTVISEGWAKAPVSVFADNDYNFTNTSYLYLNGMNTSDISLFAFNAPIPFYPKNSSRRIWNWNLWTTSLDSKTITSTSRNHHVFIAPLSYRFAYGYVIGVDLINDNNNIPQVYLYRTRIIDGIELPPVAITSNKNASFSPALAANEFTCDGKNLYFFYYAANYTKVNCISIPLEGSAVGREFTLTLDCTGLVTTAVGKALSSSQVYANWMEGDAYKVAVVDFSSGTLSGLATLGNYNKRFKCGPFVTDHKNYGVWCKDTNIRINDIYISANSTNLVKMFTFVSNGWEYIGSPFSYGGNIGFFYDDQSNYEKTIASYEIWDVEEFKTVMNRTKYLIFNPNSFESTQYKTPSGATYFVLWNSWHNPDYSVSSIKTAVKIGLLLDPPVTPDHHYSWYIILAIAIILAIIGAIVSW